MTKWKQLSKNGFRLRTNFSIWNLFFDDSLLSSWAVIYSAEYKTRELLEYITVPLHAVEYCRFVEDNSILYNLIKRDNYASAMYVKHVREDNDIINRK